MYMLSTNLTVPLLSRKLAARLSQSEANHMGSLMTHLCEHLSLPGSRCETVGQAKVLLNPGGLLGPMFNRCIGLSNEDLDRLPELFDLFREANCSPRFDISPYDNGTLMMQALSDLGLYCARHHSFLYVTASANATAYSGEVEVRRVDESRIADFADVWRRSFLEVAGIPPFAPSDWIENMAAAVATLHGKPDWRLYLAYIEGRPAGAAGLHLHEGIASLAIAGTLPEYRNRGCQIALLVKRLQDAALTGYHIVAAQSGLLTASQRNMERCGLRIAFHRSVWIGR